MEYKKSDFSRTDENDDSIFYSRERFVSHLDSEALATIKKLIGDVVSTDNCVILDLMASWDSHLPDTLIPATVIGLGMNEKEMAQNKALSEYIVYDINRSQSLPFEDNTFDVVICTVSVDYMINPIAIFREVGRILKPGGLYLVIFSNRMFPTKAVRIWRDSSDEERIALVEDLFRQSRLFEEPHVFISRGKERPKDDKYAKYGIPSDPIYAVYAQKIPSYSGQEKSRESLQRESNMNKEDILQKKEELKETLRCPYCNAELNKWEVPQTVFNEWPNEYFYICFNDDCPYFIRGWEAMASQGNHCTYRLMYDPLTDCCHPIPVMSRTMLKDGIIA